MHQHPDPIPVLPAMPHRRRRRRRSHGPLVVLMLGGTLAALAVMVLIVKERNRRLADETFERAEGLFQNGAFGKARHEYEFFLREYAGHKRATQASMAAELSQVAQALDDDLADPGGVIDGLNKFAVASKTDQSLQERWPVILTKARRSSLQFLEKANRALAASDLAAGETWLNWLRGQQRAKAAGSERLGLEELDALAKQTSERIAAEERRHGFEEAAERAIANPRPSHFAAAFRAYDGWRAGASATDKTVVATYDRLRQALRAQVRFGPPPESTGETVPDDSLLPLEAYTRLSMPRQHTRIALPPENPVFARVKDLCFALEPATGAPRWVRRVGYDAGMPELVSLSTRRAVLVSQVIDARPIVSLCDAASVDVLWSWRGEEG